MELEEASGESQETAELSLKEELTKVFDEVITPEAETPDIKQDGRPRDESGKFVKNEKQEPQEKPAAPADKQLNGTELPPQDNKPKTPPQSWRTEAKAKWQELPDWAKDEILKREGDTHKLVSNFDEERSFGKAIRDVVMPYMPIINAEGGTPVAAVQSLLNTAYLLRTSDPQTKTNLIMDIAKQYGADLSQVSTQTEYVDPDLKALRDEITQLKGQLTQYEGNRTQAQNQAIASQIQAFASDPKNVHFDAVADDMAILIKAAKAQGRELSLQEAYEQALWTKPDIRSSLIEQQTKDAEAKRIAEAKAKTEAAKRAGVSLKGSPGVAVPAVQAPADSLRDELARQLDAAGWN